MRIPHIALLLPSVIALGLSAPAAANPPQEVIDALCRSHLFAGTIKLGRDTIKQLGKCHSQRLNETLAADTDCNVESNAPWGELRARDAESLRIRARKRCDVPPALAPAVLGFDSCPVPCDADVPAISTYADVADCLVCQTYRAAEILSTQVFGTPTLPAGAEEPCWARLTRVVRHYVGVVLKGQRACALARDKGKLPIETDCRTYDPRGRVAKAVALVGKGVSYCSDQDLEVLDSCGDNRTDEETCLVGAIDAATFSLFDAVY